MLLIVSVNIIAYYYATWNYVTAANFGYLNTIICIVSCIFIYSKRSIVVAITRNDFWIMLFSLVFSSSLFIGKAIYYTNISIDVNLWSVVVLISDTSVFFAYIKILFYYVNDIKIREFDSKVCKLIFGSVLRTALLILLLWFPVYLAYYPGAFCYDAWCQMNWEWSKFHPVLHTLVMKFLIYLGALISDNVGIVLYALTQMLICALTFAYVVKYLYNKGYKFFSLVSFCFYAINPVIVIFSFLTTKDILCGTFFLLFIISLYKYLEDNSIFESVIKTPRDYRKIGGVDYRCVIFGLLCCLLRNNMIYALLVSSIFYSLMYKRKKIYRLFIAIICSFFVVNNLIYPLLGVKEGDEKEKLCVPIQQIVYVYSEEYNNLTLEEKEKIEFFMPSLDVKLFNLRNADPMKACFDTETYITNKRAFWDNYILLLLKYPKDYCVAFLQLNIPYWYQYANTIDELSQLQYIEEQLFYVNDEITPIRPYKFPIIYKIYHEFASYNIPKIMSFLYVITAINVPVWIMLLSFFYCLYYGKRNELSLIILPLIFWLTFLLGPLANMRYIMPFYFLYPIFLYTIIVKKNTGLR